MASTISAGTTSGTALNFASDTTGILQLQTNGTTTAITVDASQNVGIGLIPFANTISKGLDLVNGAGLFGYSNNSYLTNNLYYDSAWKYKGTGFGTTIIGNSADGAIQFNGTSVSGSAGGAATVSERMRIASTGYVGIGTASPSTYLHVAGAPISANIGVMYVQSTSAGDVGATALSISKTDNNSTTSQIFVKFAIANYGAGCGQINANGASSAAFGSFSDSRIKENIVDLPSQLQNVLALKPVEFDYIESEGGGHQIGFIAQDMQEIYPDVVGERDDGMLTVTGWDKTTARLVKAIQELNAKVDAQAATITALQAKVGA